MVKQEIRSIKGQDMIDINKKYETAYGREVRLYADDGQHPYVIHGAVLRDEGWEAEQWTIEGRYNKDEECGWDLVGVEQ